MPDLTPRYPLDIHANPTNPPPTAYAAYFDYQRRAHPDFRRGLRRNERHQVRSEKEEAKAETQHQRQKVKQAVAAAVDEGFPSDPSEKESYFMTQVSQGEILGSDREFSPARTNPLDPWAEVCSHALMPA
ncbi:hypothetical protein IMZ48_34625 [Candidatus Bathyarchaeota archaeon]|nr:hypothetical protein [Candidatus Bathyarchaeota archaeon]